MLRNLAGAMALAVGIGLLPAAADAAARLSAVKGEVRVNQGTGYKAFRAPLNLDIGWSVMVAPGSSAVVQYPDGCQVAVQPGALVVIAERSPCGSETASQEHITGTWQTTQTTQALPSNPTQQNSDSQQNSSSDMTPLIIGGIAAAGGIGLAIGLSGGDNNPSPPASP